RDIPTVQSKLDHHVESPARCHRVCPAIEVAPHGLHLATEPQVTLFHPGLLEILVAGDGNEALGQLPARRNRYRVAVAPGSEASSRGIGLRGGGQVNDSGQRLPGQRIIESDEGAESRQASGVPERSIDGIDRPAQSCAPGLVPHLFAEHGIRVGVGAGEPCADLRSPSLSAEVTTEPSALRSIARLGLRKAARISADACCAARTARSRISRTGGIDADMEARYQLGAAVSSAAPGLSALLGLGELHGELIRLPPD